ncbi:hypothetical protein N9W44_06955 [Alphaproteobacteria bacterium]|nr:hypothetical protein [Alphaproteobacteria bacterium]
MRYLLSAFVISLSQLFLTTISHAETDTACVRNGDGAITINGAVADDLVSDTNGNDGESCKEVPDFYKVTFYRFGLCKSDPILNENSFASCALFVNSDAGVEHVIEGRGVAAELDVSTADELIIPGEYSHLVLLLSNALQIQHTETFSSSIFGTSGAGNVCWTINKSTAFAGQRVTGMTAPAPGSGSRSTLAMECGAAVDGSLDYTTEIFDSLGEDNAPWSGQMLSASGNIRLLQEDNVTTATNADNGARMLISLPNNATVTETSQFSMNFRLTDAVSIDLAPDNGNIYALKNGADPFEVTLTVTN